jgi:GH15 family glucan-1,4-alpha-glucosidase
VLVLALSVVALVAATTWAIRRTRAPEHATIGLYLDGLAREASGAVVAVPPWAGVTYLPGTRVSDPEALAAAAADRAWLSSGTVPGAGGPYEELAAGALLDLRALTAANGALIAAPHRTWAYVWPRDASFGAAALAVTGHPDDALAVLLHLQALQGDDGSFQARYLPDGSGRVPDDRRAQSDGAGWALWAAAALLAEVPDAERADVAVRLTPLTDRSTAFIRRQLATPTGLPLASSDFWEVRPRRLTLGTAAPLLAGLEAARAIYRAAGRSEAAEEARIAAERLRIAIVRYFGRDGFPRELGHRLPDAASAFLLPPFQPAPLDGAVRAWRGSVPRMLRPAGGLAPGAGWKRDGVSWTPQTALYALAAATIGDRASAQGWLDWLARHRTPSGALPEKVLADGSPAAVAPLAWTCALVVLAVHALEQPPEA